MYVHREFVLGVHVLSGMLAITTGAFQFIGRLRLRAGASGFLLKRGSPERLLDAIRMVAAGEALLDPAVTRDLIERYIGIANGAALDRPADPSAQRTLDSSHPRERQVLLLVGQGRSRR